MQTRISHVKIYALTHLTQDPDCVGMSSTWMLFCTLCFGWNIVENNHCIIILILWGRFHARVWLGIEQRARPLFRSNPELLVLPLIWAWLPQLCSSKNATVDKVGKWAKMRGVKTNSTPPTQGCRGVGGHEGGVYPVHVWPESDGCDLYAASSTIMLSDRPTREMSNTNHLPLPHGHFMAVCN